MSVYLIKTTEVEDTMEFFSRMGLAFVKEKHGDGPEHYAAQVGDDVFEIYPSTNKGSCGFLERWKSI